MRVGIVNDAAMNLRILREVLERQPGMTVAWEATDGAEAVRKCAQFTPDMILMDIVMPGAGGVEAIRTIMANTPCIILVVTAGVEKNTQLVFEAMAAGALDAVDMPALNGDNVEHVLRKMRSLARLLKRRPKLIGSGAAAAAGQEESDAGRDKPLLIAIGASTGGPAALKTILAQLPANLHAAVLIAQHLDQQFAPMMAEWLGKSSGLPVAVAAPGERPAIGRALMAGTNEHMVLTEDGSLAYCEDPVELVYRPSVDEFFASAALYWPGPIIGVLLTGMGDDGAKGLLALKRLGHYTIAQDEASSIVYGMPKAAARLGAAVRQMPLQRISGLLVELATQHANRS